MTDGVKDNGLTLKGELLFLFNFLLRILSQAQVPLFCSSFMTGNIIVTYLNADLCLIGSQLQASYFFTRSSYSEVDTRPPGLS